MNLLVLAISQLALHNRKTLDCVHHRCVRCAIIVYSAHQSDVHIVDTALSAPKSQIDGILIQLISELIKFRRPLFCSINFALYVNLSLRPE